MTTTNIALIYIAALLLIALSVDAYKKFVLKKKVKRNYWSVLWIPLLYFIFLWDGHYYISVAEYGRKKENIPQIEQTMQLEYRSRFKEIWVNKDTSKIKHSVKIVRLGQSIEREIDYFTNSLENKSLRIMTTFPWFSSNIKKEYALLNGIIEYEESSSTKENEIQISEAQKDSLLKVWGVDKQN